MTSEIKNATIKFINDSEITVLEVDYKIIRGNRAKCNPFNDGELELSELAKDWNNGHWDDSGG